MPVKTPVVVCLLLLVGCAVHPRFPVFDAGTPEQALNELISRSRMIDSYSASAVFEISSPNGNIRFNGEVVFGDGCRWRVDLDGPLGVKLAVVETESDSFRVHLPQAGRTSEGRLCEGLELPDLEISLPAVASLSVLLLPTVDLTGQESWRIVSAGVGNPGLLTLVSESEAGIDSLVLSLDYSPVRILSEEHWREGRLLFTRNLSYKRNPGYLPDRITIKSSDLTLYIKLNYHRLVLITPLEVPES